MLRKITTKKANHSATFSTRISHIKQKSNLKQVIMQDSIVAAIVFYGFYHIIKLISEHFLKRKLINSGHVEQTSILASPVVNSEEVNRYPSLKWGLIAFMAGLGLIIIEILRSDNPDAVNFQDSVLPYGIELVFISLGFLIYFFIVNNKKK
jgi:hypothetical protein